MSIRPVFASAILSGLKRYEFRRRIFARPVNRVVIYATVPVRQVIAEFKVKTILSGSPSTLWKRTRQYAGISRGVFFEYFDGAKRGYAIEIGEVKAYDLPYCPIKKLGVRPPQSFTYLVNERRT